MKTQQSWSHKVLFVVAWTLIVARTWAPFKTSRMFEALAGIGVGLNWPISILWLLFLYIAFTTLFVWIGVFLYSAIWKQFSAGALRRSLLFTLGIMTATHLALIPFPANEIPGWAWFLPTFVCLIGSMMIASKVGLKDSRSAA